MKAVIQRVKSASVSSEGELLGKIDHGLAILLAVADSDNLDTIKFFANKLTNLRIFEDQEGKMNRSLLDVGGDLLIVSNFTIYADARKGYRPSFSQAGEPNYSNKVFDELLEYIRNNYPIKVETGRFGAMMDVSIVNDGPVTIVLEK
jgi:D-tyrosyl-tRNA(Tyr) deacylase